jgi:hypothetical protein
MAQGIVFYWVFAGGKRVANFATLPPRPDRACRVGARFTWRAWALYCVKTIFVGRADVRLPESVQEVADVIGRENALRLVGALPSLPSKPWIAWVSVPQPARLRPDHDLVAILGWPGAVLMCRAFGGELLQLSRCRGLERAARNRRIWDLRAQGMNARQIGEIIDVSPETVKKVLQLGPTLALPAPTGNPPIETKGANDNDRGKSDIAKGSTMNRRATA